ncbi:outer membrane beta-barrel protein [Helicobacter sp. MIT 14-3879]|uniref:outer membrane beta-barrel protein n=1 Tax=Helicobacter sp. MIT 14-3879 TaxID=2040649 RepID=UPI000E1F6D2E|nr:outer membrane beta-barrel protein [Helicobacter sp. MIT 14-3879]RDU65084.1 hypothetical protein CQA44_01880 [Helicobacter sp. MIT 14-3879]
MKRLVILMLICFGLSADDYNEINNNTREKNGIFIGFEIGNGETMFKQDFASVGNTYYYGIDMKISSNLYGGKVGYKYFFNDYVGIRGYFNLDYQGALYKLKGSVGSNSQSSNVYTDLLNFGINADVLVNFYNTNFLNVGLFAGLGIGGVKSEVQIDANKDDMIAFDTNFKVGLRLNIEQNHGVEFVAKIPMIESKRKADMLGLGVETTQKVKQVYSLGLSYLYTF